MGEAARTEGQSRPIARLSSAVNVFTLPDRTLQKQYDISRYYLLNNTGGTYWGFIGIDNVIYETCLPDNLFALHALVETNHLEAARGELDLLEKYFPMAKENAATRMEFVLGSTNPEAALLPFYMTEDAREWWERYRRAVACCLEARAGSVSEGTVEIDLLGRAGRSPASERREARVG